MKLHIIPVLALVAALTACGGGGGSPGTSHFGSGSSQTVSSDPVIKSASLLDSSGAATTSIAASGFTLLSVKLTDPKGNPLPNQLIDVSGDTNQVAFPEGPSGLTNASGVATIKLTRASLTATGAGSLTVTYSYRVGNFSAYPDGSPAPTADKVITAYVGYQLAAANVTLSNLDVGASTLPAYGTRPISVQATINGAPATSPVQVTFSASCGQISPSSASTNSSGIALVSYSATDPAGAAQSTQGCSGQTVQITASILGGSSLSANLNVQSAPATNMSFVDATPTRIYLANSGGPTQSIVRFKLVNARGEPLLGQSVTLSLKTLNGGIPKATLGTVGNTSPITSTTDANGMVSVAVFSGTVPTNVLVNAALTSNSAVQTDSAVLAIASGRPVQSRVSLSLEKFSIEGWNTDGQEATVTMSLADRQGNPVPDGTVVNFVTSGGVMIPPTCTTGSTPGDSRCTVSIRAQNPRPTGGRVAIMAYSPGEEDFVDANFNNVYDCGESFTDLGTAYRDDNFNGIFDSGEFSVPRAAEPSACAVAAVTPTPTHGDGVWGAADVRGQIPIVFASSQAIIGGSFSGSTFTTTVRDVNGNSMPTGSQITVTGAATGTDGHTCTINSDATLTIPNTYGATAFPVVFACNSGDVLTVKVTTPLNVVTTSNFTVQ